MRFWSLGRSGLFSVSGRPTLRVFIAAVGSCGLPQPKVYVTGNRFGNWLEVGLLFHSGTLFRCHFTQKVSPTWARRNGSPFWFRPNGQPRALKPSNFDNPLSRWVNRQLFAGDITCPRDLTLRERALLALGF